jgi:hypothetical protein
MVKSLGYIEEPKLDLRHSLFYFGKIYKHDLNIILTIQDWKMKIKSFFSKIKISETKYRLLI